MKVLKRESKPSVGIGLLGNSVLADLFVTLVVVAALVHTINAL